VLLAQRFLKWLKGLEATVCVIAFSAAAIALIADVLGREFFGSGIFGAQRFAVWATAISGLVGFALVTAEGGHLRPQFSDKWLPKSIEPHIDRIADLVSAVIFIGLGIYAYDFVMSAYRLGERGMAIPIKVWPIQVILPWMFFSSASRHIIFFLWPSLRPVPKEELL
jgi:TRAP-type C4-dicarboxylate transport system permease small subunit